MFRVADIFPPYTEDGAQDSWVGTIDEPGHTRCIEVYLFEDMVEGNPETVLRERLQTIVDVLNNTGGDFDGAMKGI